MMEYAEKFIHGIMAGGTAAALTHPFYNMKNHLQNGLVLSKQQYGNRRWLYNGLSRAIPGYGVEKMIVFGVYGSLRKHEIDETLSGIIAGYTENLSVYYKIPERIERQPLLRRNFTKEKLQKMSQFFRVHAGPISGNISLGFFLGSTFIIGKFLGLNIDIRHITFSAGTFGVALAGLDNILSLADWIFTFIGIFLIGGFNFLISFVMSLFVALRSRSISITKLPEVISAVGKIWHKNKRQFFVPVKEDKV